MKESNTKLLGIVIGLLIIVNIGTLTLFWFTRMNHDTLKENRGGGGAAAFLIKELGFDSIQIEQFNMLKQEHQHSLHDIKKQIGDAKETYFKLLIDSTVSEQAIKEAAAKASVFEQQVDIITFHHLQKVRRICTPAQQKKFDEIIIDVIRMMGKQGAPPPRNRDNDTGRDSRPPEGDGFPPPPPSNEPPQR